MGRCRRLWWVLNVIAAVVDRMLAAMVVVVGTQHDGCAFDCHAGRDDGVLVRPL